MIYCKSCLTTNLRPNARFNDQQVCIACEYQAANSELSDSLYLNRLAELKQLLLAYRKSSGYRKKTPYDCVVGVSGGKDSTRQALWVRDRLKLNPLLVCVAYPPAQMTEIGGANLANLMQKGFDIEVVTPAPLSSAALSLLSFERFGNVNKSTEMALFSSVPRIAVEKKIPLIFWGENPALQVGDSATLGENQFDGNQLRNLNTLVDGGDEWLAVSDTKRNFYKYPSEKQLQEAGVQIIYLGPAWNDWANHENAEFAALSGLELRPGEENLTGDISGASMLDEEFTNINMMLKYYKFGFGRATDICNELIRMGRTSRSEAIELVQKYDGVCSDGIIQRYCDYVGISIDRFWEIVQSYVNTTIFELTGERPIPKFRVGVDLA